MCFFFIVTTMVIQCSSSQQVSKTSLSVYLLWYLPIQNQIKLCQSLTIIAQTCKLYVIVHFQHKASKTNMELASRCFIALFLWVVNMQWRAIGQITSWRLGKLAWLHYTPPHNIAQIFIIENGGELGPRMCPFLPIFAKIHAVSGSASRAERISMKSGTQINRYRYQKPGYILSSETALKRVFNIT